MRTMVEWERRLWRNTRTQIMKKDLKRNLGGMFVFSFLVFPCGFSLFPSSKTFERILQYSRGICFVISPFVLYCWCLLILTGKDFGGRSRHIGLWLLHLLGMPLFLFVWIALFAVYYVLGCLGLELFGNPWREPWIHN